MDHLNVFAKILVQIANETKDEGFCCNFLPGWNQYGTSTIMISTPSEKVFTKIVSITGEMFGKVIMNREFIRHENRDFCLKITLSDNRPENTITAPIKDKSENTITVPIKDIDPFGFDKIPPASSLGVPKNYQQEIDQIIRDITDKMEKECEFPICVDASCSKWVIKYVRDQMKKKGYICEYEDSRSAHNYFINIDFPL